MQHFQRSAHWEYDAVDRILCPVHFIPFEPLAEAFLKRFLHKGHNVVRGIVLEIDLDGGH